MTMRILFEIIKFLYYCVTIGLAVLYFKGNERFGNESATMIIQGTLPAYYIFTGILLGYIAYEIGGDGEHQMSTYFVGGTIVGIILVVLSLTLGRGNFELAG